VGLTLTPNGERYLEACQLLLEQNNAADALMTLTARSRGVLAIGAHPELVQLPWLSRFHIRYPAIQIDVRPVNRNRLLEVSADVYLVHGWLNQPDLVHRRIAQARLLTCASPAYWAKYGAPQRPLDLERHHCLLYANDEGTVSDMWKFERNGKIESVIVDGWLISNNRKLTVDAAIAGEGVIRVSDLMFGEELRSGRLIPVLLDWTMRDAPPINILFAASQRRNARVRLFIDFVTEAYRSLETEFNTNPGPRPFADRPHWHRRNRRASAAMHED
jgi:LysR family transcriptional regulator, regulator for bpeEF and oprC